LCPTSESKKRSERVKTGRTVRFLSEDEKEEHLKTLNMCYNPWGDEKEWRRRYAWSSDFDVTRNVLLVEENGEWAGGGTAWLREAFLSNNGKIKVYEAGDLYVLPQFRGKGIYSTAMRSLNETAQKGGSVLGFGFPSIYGVAASALPKYGFVDAFYPVTKIFLLKPEKFLNYFISRLEEFVLPKKLDGLRVKLTVSLGKADSAVLSKSFIVETGQLKELTASREDEKADLKVKADIELLAQASSLFYRHKRTLFLYMFSALLRRRLGVRFSFKFLKALVGF